MYESCLKCGTVQNLTTHHIYPRCFRRFADKEIRCTCRLCLECHSQYEKSAEQLKRSLCYQYTGRKLGHASEYYNKLYRYLGVLSGREKGYPVPTVKYVRAQHYCKGIQNPFGLKREMMSLEVSRQLYCIFLSVGQDNLINMWVEHFNAFIQPRKIKAYCVRGVDKRVGVTEKYILTTSTKFIKKYRRQFFNLEKVYNIESVK